MVDRRCARDFCANSIVGVGVTYLFTIDASVHTKVLSHKKLNRRSCFTEGEEIPIVQGKSSQISLLDSLVVDLVGRTCRRREKVV